MTTPRRVIWFTAYVIGCIAGLALVVYGIVGWSHSGFYIGRQPVASDPSTRGQERGLIFMGLALSGYCFYALWSATHIPARKKDEDDTPPNI